MVSVFPTLAGVGVVLGGVIDYGTGAVYNLQPNPVVANLRCPDASPVVSTPALVPAVVTTGNEPGSSQLEAKLVELRSPLDKGLITQAEYERKRTEILRGL